MVAVFIKNIFYRILLPASFILAALIRPSILSLFYALIALLNPLFPRIRASYPLSTATKGFLIFTVVCSLITALLQLIYQVTEHVHQPVDVDYVKECESDTYGLRFWLRQVGFIRVPTSGIIGFRFMLPEIIALISSLVSLIICLTNHNSSDLSESVNPTTSRHSGHDSQFGYSRSAHSAGHPSRLLNVLKPSIQRLSDVLLTLFTLFIGVIQPSLLNSVYFLLFLFMLSWYAFYKSFGRTKLNNVKRFLVGYCGFHLLILYAYQIDYVKSLIPPEYLAARLIGLTDLVAPVSCANWWDFSFNSYWAGYVNFVALWVFYFVSITQYKWTRWGIRSSSSEEVNDGASSDHEELKWSDLPADANVTDNSEGLLPSGDIEQAGPNNIPLQRITSAALDRQKISVIFKRPGDKDSCATEGLTAVTFFFLHHSYVFVLLAMMTWALLYHSVFGLIFLFTACVLWAVRDSRKWCFHISPILLLYVEFLLLSQYIYSLDLIPGEELPVNSVLEIIGFRQPATRTAAIVTLIVKSFLSLPFFILLRLHLRERYYESLSEHDRRKRLNYGTFSTPRPAQAANQLTSDASSTVFTFLSTFFTKYWIFVVAFVLLLNGLTSPPVDYTATYLVLACVLVLLLHTNFVFFRRIVFIFWTLLIIYSSVILLAVYTYQFPKVPQIWQRFTHLSAEDFARIGLVDYQDERNGSLLFIRLLLPILLVLVTMLQLKFFHDPWVKLVQTSSLSSSSPIPDSRPSSSAARSVSVVRKVREVLNGLVEILWRLAEVHLPKLVLLILIITASTHICVLNFVLVAFVALAVCLPACSWLISLLLTVYLTLSTVTRVVYLINIQNNNNSQFANFGSEDCPEIGTNRSLQSVSQWLGFGYTASVFEHDIIGLVIVLVVIAVQLSVKYRQLHVRRLRGEDEPAGGLIFPGHNAADYDRSIKDCLKFFFNHGFYKFGLEFSMIMMAIVVWNRMDLMGALIAFWLLVVAILPRRFVKIIWPIFLLYLAIMLPLQYAMWVGLPETLCLPYPWSSWLIPDKGRDTTILGDNLLKLLDLANYRQAPTHVTSKLVADFILILVVASQECVFRQEKTAHPAGDNYSIYSSGDYTLRSPNPRHDFISEQRSFVDYFKIAVFMYGHWVTLIMVLVAGLGGTSLFALGYLVLAFWMLWQGNNLYTMTNYRRTLSRWNFLLFYTIAVMICKASLQIVGCVFIAPLNSSSGCIVRQLFSIICVDEVSCDALDTLPEAHLMKSGCAVDQKETRIGFDTIAFCFLVFQLRILHSWFFQHCMIDFRCEIVQSSRGALLINQLIEKEMKEQNVQQKAKFDEIRERTAFIRKQYEEQQRKGNQGAFQPQTYGQDGARNRPLSMIDVDDPFPMYDPRVADHIPAKRAGDYYMFNYEPDTDELVAPVDTFIPEVTPGAGDFDKLDPAQLLHTAISKEMDLQGTLNAVETAEKIKDEEQRMIRAIATQDSQPSTSSDVNRADDAEDGNEDAKMDTLTMVLRFVGKIMRSFAEWTAAFLNRRSREHRYVAYVLNQEKGRLMRDLRSDLLNERKSLKEIRCEWEGRSMRMICSESDVERLECEAANRWEQRNLAARITTAIGNCIAAHTDAIAYLIACIAHARCAGLITLPLPLMVFFWGTLASPRPSKNFWVAMISYTEFEIIVKFIFQFGFFPWNSRSADTQTYREPYRPQNVFGVQKVDYFAFWDVALLIALFFHRYMLRRLGLWKDANIMDTFVETTVVTRPSNEVDVTGRSSQSSEEPIEAVDMPNEQRGPMSSFIFKLFHPKFRYIRDLYPVMFFLDVACFFIVVFGFSSFGTGGSGDVISDLSSNRVPLTFVIMLIVITLMIVIDRGLYLRKAILCKLIYQLVTVVFMHVWIFFALPAVTSTAAAMNKVAQFLYVVKCIYFLISSWQIRNGYPQLCIGNLLTHSYGLVNMVLFKLFMLAPFLFELRTAIDWTWTDTSMPILDFFSMENFYSTIYSLKCARTFEQNFPAPRGIPKGTIVKYSIGIPLILAIVLIIWFPLLAFSLLNRIGTFLPPEKVQLSLSIEGYPPLFTMEAQGVAEINALTVEERKSLIKIVSEAMDGNRTIPNENQFINRIRRGVSFIEDYTSDDIYRVHFRPVSETFWTVSSDSFDALRYQLQSKDAKNPSIRININFAVQRRREASKEPIQHTTVFTVKVTPTEPEDVWQSLYNAISTPVGGDKPEVKIARFLPYFLTVPNEGEVKIADALHQVFDYKGDDVNSTYSTVSLKLNKQNETDFLESLVWQSQTTMSESLSAISNHFKPKIISYLPNKLKYLETFIFIDRVFPQVLIKYAEGGIIAMYIALVLFVSRMIRGVVANQPLDVIITEIPNPDHLLKICLDIYLVREAKDFVLEQDMYAKLIFLFRSPATLIKWTRYKPKQE